MKKERSQYREKKETRRDQLTKEDKATRSLLVKNEIQRGEKRIEVKKKFETKTKGRERTGSDKERKFEFEMNSKPDRKKKYTRPVVHVEMKKEMKRNVC